MSYVSSIQCRELTKSFTFEIQKFMRHCGRTAGVLSSPEFSFDGIENEKYKGNVTADSKHERDYDGYMACQVLFSVNLSNAGSATSGNLSCITSIVSVSRHDAMSGAISMLGESESTHYGMVSEESKAFCTYRVPYSELTSCLNDEDGARVGIKLRLLYAYTDPDWKPESPFPHSSRRNILKRPAYEEPLAKREKTDFAIQCGGQEFPVHSLVLKLVSPVFDRMIQTDMVEAASGRIAIKDMEPEVIVRMLDCLYESKMFSEEEEPSDDSLIQLLHCAEKYQIADMKKEVLNQMFLQLTVDNAIKFVAALKMYNAGEVVWAQALEFCKRNLSALKKDSEFREFFLEHMEALM